METDSVYGETLLTAVILSWLFLELSRRLIIF